MDFLKSTKGGPFELAGVRIPEEGGGCAPAPPKSAPEYIVCLAIGQNFFIQNFEEFSLPEICYDV